MSEVTIRSQSKATITSVAGSISSVTLVSANPGRKRLVIGNASTAILYVRLGGGTATATTGHSIQIPSLGNYSLEGFTGAITGIWAAANGSAQITELE